MTLEFPLNVPSEEEELYDVAIIGGGPAGLTAAMYAARADLKTVVLDKSPTVGALGLTDKIENYPGVPQAMTGAELVDIFRNQAETFGAKVIQTQVIGVNFNSDPKEVITLNNAYHSKTVIVATGSMGHKPTLKGEAEFVGKGVSYCAVCDAAFFKNRTVAVVGEIGEVIQEIHLIAKFAQKVYLFLHGKAPDSEHLEMLHMIPNLKLMDGYHVEQIFGSTGVEGITVIEPTGSQQVLEVWGVFVYLHGNKPIIDFLQGALETTPEGCIRINKVDMSASVSGVYAVGDVTCKEIRQAVVAAAEGCIAALSADKYLHRRQKARSQWS